MKDLTDDEINATLILSDDTRIAPALHEAILRAIAEIRWRRDIDAAAHPWLAAAERAPNDVSDRLGKLERRQDRSERTLDGLSRRFGHLGTEGMLRTSSDPIQDAAYLELLQAAKAHRKTSAELEAANASARLLHYSTTNRDGHGVPVETIRAAHTRANEAWIAYVETRRRLELSACIVARADSSRSDASPPK